jgi:formylmethanofuran dehydrogenase subunit B
MVNPQFLNDATCTFCGCACDDIRLKVEASKVVEAEHACALGRSWFFESASEHPSASIEGRPATLDEAIGRAASILADARYPLVYGLSQTSCETQRSAAALADSIGACIDIDSGSGGKALVLAMQSAGQVTCTLGEVKNRADLVIFWGCDPVLTHPRHWERYSALPRGLWVPHGRSDRTVIVVDERPNESAAQADMFLRVPPGTDFEVLWGLRALVKGSALDEAVVDGMGIDVKQVADLAQRMKSSRFGVLFFEPNASADGTGKWAAEAACRLVSDLNDHTRFYLLALGKQGNVAGAESVLTWQTGFPFAVSLNRGYPRYGPGEFSGLEILARRETDAALIVASEPDTRLTPEARRHLARIPTVVLDSKQTSFSRPATVSIGVATFGIDEGGTLYRCDGISIPIQPALSSPLPHASTVLEQLRARIHELQNGRTAGADRVVPS